METTSKLPASMTFRTFASDIKLAHSIFALPFVLVTLIFLNFNWNLGSLFWILVCMVAARSFAMGLNRYLDRDIDALNPRTQKRMIPDGKLSPGAGLRWSLRFGIIFIFCAFQLNTTAGFLSPLVLLILGSYPFMKRISWLTHWYLGTCLGLSPLATSVALTGSLHPEACLLGLAVMMWTAGFDILYSLQDWQFDRKHSLKSVPTRFGIKNSLRISRLCFVLMVLALSTIGLIRGSGTIYFLGIATISGILIWEHWMVRSSNEREISSNINLAFFNANACVSIIYFVFTQLDASLFQ